MRSFCAEDAVVTMFSLILMLIPSINAGWSGDSRSSEPCQCQRRHQIMQTGNRLAWGRPRSTDDVMLKTGKSLEEKQTTKTICSAEDDISVDDSWTISAFRAFHEMRAGRPPFALDGKENEQHAGSPASVRRGAFWLPRLIDTARGERADDRGGGGGGESGGPRRQRRDQTSLSGDEANSDTVAAAAKATSCPKPAVCWHMQGRLTNAATGQTIALVEGVELTRSLAFETTPRNRGGGIRSRNIEGRSDGATEEVVRPVPARATDEATPEDGKELEVDRMLKSLPWKAFGTLACSKFFMYQDPKTREPMEFFRNTPVEKKQMVKTYECFSQVVSHILHPNGRVMVVGEWGGRSIKAETANSNGVEEMDGFGNGYGFGPGALGLGRESSASSPRRVFNLHFFVEARTPREERDLKRWQNRPGAKWIAFGSTPPRAHGCKEAYSYVTGSRAGEKNEQESRRRNSARVKRGNAAVADAPEGEAAASSGSGGLMSYTRYGECPTWYATGRMCGLDVQARRVDSFESLPAKLRERVLRVDPKFDAGPRGCTMEEYRLLAVQEQEMRKEERRKNKWSLRRPFARWGSGGIM